jgi:hypothetical protein
VPSKAASHILPLEIVPLVYGRAVRAKGAAKSSRITEPKKSGAS